MDGTGIPRVSAPPPLFFSLGDHTPHPPGALALTAVSAELQTLMANFLLDGSTDGLPSLFTLLVSKAEQLEGTSSPIPAPLPAFLGTVSPPLQPVGSVPCLSLPSPSSSPHRHWLHTGPRYRSQARPLYPPLPSTSWAPALPSPASIVTVISLRPSSCRWDLWTAVPASPGSLLEIQTLGVPGWLSW